jgi:hypothetical protein
MVVAAVVSCNYCQQGSNSLPTAMSDIPPPTTGKLEYIGSFLLTQHGLYWRMHWLTGEMDFLFVIVDRLL